MPRSSDMWRKLGEDADRSAGRRKKWEFWRKRYIETWMTSLIGFLVDWLCGREVRRDLAVVERNSTQHKSMKIEFLVAANPHIRKELEAPSEQFRSGSCRAFQTENSIKDQLTLSLSVPFFFFRRESLSSLFFRKHKSYTATRSSVIESDTDRFYTTLFPPFASVARRTRLGKVGWYQTRAGSFTLSPFHPPTAKHTPTRWHINL